MTGVHKSTKILALPVLRKKWLYAVEETVEDLKALPSWRTGRTIAERAKLGQAQLLQEVHRRILKQWEDLKQAPVGSIKQRIHRLAQSVLDQEDVSETFLKGLPSATGRYDILYPSGTPERYVRRRMRLFLRQQEGFQKCRAVAWAMASVPLIPLMVAPFPNIPLYYAGWRAYSHNKALKGCKRLLESMQGSTAGTSSPATAGVRMAATAASPAKPGAATDEADMSVTGAASQAAGSPESGRSSSSSSKSLQPALVYMLPEKELARYAQVNKRRSAPAEEPALDAEGAKAIGERYGLPELPALLSRLLKGVTITS